MKLTLVTHNNPPKAITSGSLEHCMEAINEAVKAAELISDHMNWHCSFHKDTTNCFTIEFNGEFLSYIILDK